MAMDAMAFVCLETRGRVLSHRPPHFSSSILFGASHRQTPSDEMIVYYEQVRVVWCGVVWG